MFFLNVMHKNLKQSGFSLVELSIIITILSIATLGFINFGTAPVNDNAEKINQTFNKMHEIDKAIRNYFAIYNRLPCPARNSLSMGTVNFDSEYISYTSVNGNECLSPNGAVPTKNLGLPNHYILDAWGRKFNYHVHQNLCGNNNFSVKNCTPSSYKNNSPALQIYSTATGTAIVTNAAYVLVGYGANGYASYSKAGTYVSASPNTYEQKNDASKTSASADFNNYYKGAMSSTFDDLIIYKTKNQLEATKYLPSNPALTMSECAANSYMLGNSNYSSVLSNARATMTATQNTDLGIIYNYGDEALLEMMWVLQDACYEIHGNNGTIPRSCSSSATNFNSTNACCPLSLSFNTANNYCW
ncbi:MAG: prepilin-type N-terminal cleavage/methylation domain-containing protein [Alphaproteobacteria bacterium]